MNMKRWQHRVVLAGGVSLLLASGSLRDGSVPFAPMANAVVVASVLVAFATLALVLRLNWNGWATLSIVTWALIASAMLSVTHAWTAVLLLGLSALALCVGSLAATPPRRRRPHGHGV
jgi:hypothetical protein